MSYLALNVRAEPGSYTDHGLRVQGKYRRDARRYIRTSAEISDRNLLTVRLVFPGFSWKRKGNRDYSRKWEIRGASAPNRSEFSLLFRH